MDKNTIIETAYGPAPLSVVQEVELARQQQREARKRRQHDEAQREKAVETQQSAAEFHEQAEAAYAAITARQVASKRRVAMGSGSSMSRAEYARYAPVTFTRSAPKQPTTIIGYALQKILAGKGKAETKLRAAVTVLRQRAQQGKLTAADNNEATQLLAPLAAQCGIGIVEARQ